MKKMILTFLCVVFCCGLAFANTTQVILGGAPNGNLTTSGTNYIQIQNQDSFGPGGIRYELVADPGIFSNFRVNLSGSPGAGTSYTLTFYLNGATTLLAVTISDNSTTNVDTTHKISVVAGDLVTIQVTDSAGAPTARTASWALNFTPRTSGDTILMTDTSLTNADFAAFYTGEGSARNTENLVQIIMPCAGTLKNFYGALTVAPGAAASGKSWTVTMRKNGVNAGSPGNMAITFLETATTGNDTTNTVAVAAGDLISFSMASANGPAGTSMQGGVVFVPSIPGQFPIIMGEGNQPSRVATAYDLLGGRASSQAAEASSQQITNAFTAKALYIQVINAPGAGLSYAFTLRDATGGGAAADTAITATLDDPNITKKDTADSVTILDGDLLDTKIVPSAGSPAATGNYSVSYLGYIEPTSDFFEMFY